MKDREPLPRKRKIANKGEYEVTPEKDYIEPKIETRQVITNFTVGEHQADKIRKRATLCAWIRENYPYITKAQLEDSAKIVYGEHHAWVTLTQYVPVQPVSKI